MIEINNLTNSAIDKSRLKKIAKKVLGEKSDLSVALVGPSKIRKLNKKYRKKDRITDVLSFTYNKEGLGEVLICPEAVKKNAKKFNSTFKEELDRVLIHGVLHLLGYKHETSGLEAKRMKEKENYYNSKI